jgi:hypothetical protein
MPNHEKLSDDQSEKGQKPENFSNWTDAQIFGLVDESAMYLERLIVASKGVAELGGRILDMTGTPSLDSQKSSPTFIDIHAEPEPDTE